MLELSTPEVNALLAHLPRCKKALIVTHQYPDMDAIGSCVAFYEYLVSQGVEVRVWSAQEVGRDFKFLKYSSNIVNEYPSEFKFDTLFVLDASHLTRVKNYHLIKFKPEDVTVVNIDHHPDNSLFGNINIVTPISSVGEIMTLILTTLNAKISPTMATALYAAISFDTGRFAHNNVTAQTMRLASTLLDAGADNFEITQAMDENKSPEDFQLVRLAIENLVCNADLGYVYTFIPNLYSENHFKVIDFIRLLSGFDIFIVFQEIGNKRVKVNLRSRIKFDVSEFAQKFGGGGHKRASGILMEGTLKDIKKNILDDLAEILSRT